MNHPAAYTVTEALSRGSRASTYRALRNADGQPVVLKVLDPQRSRPNDLERLKHELEIRELLDTSAVVKLFALETYQGMPALVLEDFGGQALDRLLGGPMAVGQFLPLAIRIAGAVAELHRQGFVHKDLKPQNILVNGKTGEVKIADLGMASQLPREHATPKGPGRIEGSLPYMSPEQTGRMNRPIDSRSDLYSLGVTFYQMLTGRLPFEAKDPLEWVHRHVAHTPHPPAEVVPDIPAVLSSLVVKLLAKMAEDRYQTALGLQRDLERCLSEWEASGALAPFQLGEHDVSDRLEIAQKLRGRDPEVGRLLEAFERVALRGTPEIVLVAGYPGVGKSSLVRELHRPIVRARGFFISGKVDQRQQDIPYSTFAQAFGSLVEQILTESEERMRFWRTELEQALGPNGQVIIDVIPQVELVMGPQPAVPHLPAAEARNRFHLVFRQLVSVFARKEHPLALFLDDLQWLDSGSLQLACDLLAHPQTGHLLLLGAYRDNDVGPGHPLQLALDHVRRAGVAVSEIVLAPLTSFHLTQLVADALRCSPDRAAPLADLIHEKTSGNPFFAIQFLIALHEERLIEFDAHAEAWRWDVAKIRAKSFTDNVVELMVAKLVELPAPARRVLKLLAALGNSAEIGVATLIHGGQEHELHADLRDAVQGGLVLRSDRAYTFLHDRVQEAAYSLVPEGERAAMHLEIGRRLWSGTPPRELAERVFDIASHLDRGAALITSREEREQVAELNLVAARRARKSTAFASALTYLAAGRALLPEDSWEEKYELTFALELARAECEVLLGAPDVEARLATLWRHARDIPDRAAVTCVRAALYTGQDRGDLAVDACLDYLRLAGIDWSPHPPGEAVLEEYDRMWRTLGGRPIAGLVDLPPVVDPVCVATMDVLSRVQSAAMFTDANLHALVVGRIVNLSLVHGRSDGSCLAYVRLGMILGPQFGDYRAGFCFGKLGLDDLERHGQRRYGARVYLNFGTNVSPWTRHVREGVPILRRAVRAAYETGDLQCAAYARNCLHSLLLAQGEPLEEVQRQAEEHLEYAQKNRLGLVADVLVGQLRLVRALRGLAPDFCSADGARLDERQFERYLEEESRPALAVCWYWIRKLQERFLAGDPAAALEAAAKAQRMFWSSPAFFEVAEYHFFAALAHAAQHGHAAPGERAQHVAAIAGHHAQLAAWAETCPENFRDRAALVAAEIARIERRDVDAVHLYEDAVGSAHENGFVQNEALALELATAFHRSHGLERLADGSLRDARASYARWGADGKVEQIDARHPHLSERSPVPAMVTLAVRPEQLDLLSVAKAAQSISGEMVLDKLVRTLLEVVLQQGGAERACLILCRDEGASIEAEAALEERGTVASVLSSEPLGASRRVPISLVHYAQRMKERVILSDAADDAGKFSADEYLARIRPRAVLCLPILRQAEVVGLLYLENNLLAGAFTPDRLAALELLATQAAISLQNAQLLANERARRSAAEEAERRAAFLAEAGALLSESLDVEETFARLGRLCVRAFDSSCVIDVLDGQEIVRLVVALADPDHGPVLDEIRRRHPPRWDSPHPAAHVLRTGKPLLLTDLDDDLLRSKCDSEGHVALVRALGAESALALPLVARGQTLGALTLVSTTPGRRYGEAALELAEELARRAANAIDNARLYRASQEAVHVRNEFLTVASHELNTPVASLVLALQALQKASSVRQTLDPPAMDRLVDLAARQGVRLTKLVGDLLDVSRIEAGGSSLDLADVDLGALVREVVLRFEADLTRSRCPVSLQGDLAVAGRWDRSRMDRVLCNLLSNAIKFGAGKPIEITVGERLGWAWLTVRDHGIGIDPAHLARIFGRFERAVSERHYGGLGLGLYICQRIAEEHGGSLRCESQLGEGSTFILDLPCARPGAFGARAQSLEE